MITGEFRASLDEKGRLLVPTKIRSEIAGDILILTKGIDNCLWLFPPQEWAKISKSILESTSMFQQSGRLIQRKIIAPASELEVDKAGRVTVSPVLREYAGLKKDVVILGIRNYVEIWDEAAYEAYLDEAEKNMGSLEDQISILWPKE